MAIDIQEFHKDFLFQIGSLHEVQGGFSRNAFTEIAVAKLEEFEETSDVICAQFEGIGLGRKRAQIDAYGFDEADDTLSLFVTDFSQSEDIDSLSQADLTALMGYLANFLSLAVSDSQFEKLEPSSSGGQAAVDIRNLLKKCARVRLYAITNKKLSVRVKSLPSSVIDNIPMEYAVWDIQRFFDAHVSVLGREDLAIDLTRWMPNGLQALHYAGESDGGFSTFLAVVPGKLIAYVYSEYGSRLLEGNVRSFLSTRGKVNKGIRATLLGSPEEFLAYNNGLSTTATSVTYEEIEPGSVKLTSISGFQIVNGGQTTVSLYNFLRFEKNKVQNLEKVYVQMKLTCVEPELVGHLIPKIAEYANTQNKVSETDFFANSPFHIRMEEISRRLLAPPKAGSALPSKWYYERARGSYLNDKLKLPSKVAVAKFERDYPRSQLIEKTYMAKVHNCWNLKPHIVSRGTQKNFIDFASQVAEPFANESTKDKFNDDFYKKVICESLIYEAAYKAIKNSDWYQTGYLANIVAYAIAGVADEINRRNLDLNWNAIWSSQAISQAFTDELSNSGKVALSVISSPTRLQQNISEWAKSEVCWKHFTQEKINFSPAFVQELRQIEKSQKAEEVQKARDLGAALGEVEVLRFLTSISRDGWARLVTNSDFRMSDKERSILSTLITTGYVSKAQGQLLMAMVNRAKGEGIVIETEVS